MGESISIATGWKKSNADVFWNEEVPQDHVVQVYENDEILIETLSSFVTVGCKVGDACVIIATEAHLFALEEKIKYSGFDMDSLQKQNRIILLDASLTLSKFMVNDWPDEQLFFTTVSAIVESVGPQNKIRAFGEMVAVLWEQGLYGATIYLEQLWEKFFLQYPLCLFCAYPKKAFEKNYESSIQHVCRKHSKMIDGVHKQVHDIVYKNITS
jgi:MEDS: MEthanogen/methylotroph, DcmR Sensory domain